jgi:thiol-disulfide isomerase/thioredoxin
MMDVKTAGLFVLVAVILVATLFGLYRRRVDGRLASGVGFRTSEDLETRPPAAAPQLSAADLGAQLGSRATLVHFSTAFCQPCRAVRRILTDVADKVDGVAHIEVDAESRLDLVRRLGIMRTPTVLVLDANGHIVRRAVGLPRRADVIAAVGDVV